ncbi:MAG: flagellar basal body rod protein FlgB [Melioribacteraceae bacterium]
MSIPPYKALERLLDDTSLKQKVIGQNIANTETIGYQRREVEFKDVLNSNIADQVNGSSNKSEFKVITDENEENISGFNNVDVNREMADMAENTILFKFGAKKITGYYRGLQNVIKGGR